MRQISVRDFSESSKFDVYIRFGSFEGTRDGAAAVSLTTEEAKDLYDKLRNHLGFKPHCRSRYGLLQKKGGLKRP